MTQQTNPEFLPTITHSAVSGFTLGQLIDELTTLRDRIEREHGTGNDVLVRVLVDKDLDADCDRLNFAFFPHDEENGLLDIIACMDGGRLFQREPDAEPR